MKTGEGTSVTGSYTYASTMGNLGLNKAQTSGGNVTSSSASIAISNAKVYTKALTAEEVKHNYLYDAQQHGIN